MKYYSEMFPQSDGSLSRFYLATCNIAGYRIYWPICEMSGDPVRAGQAVIQLLSKLFFGFLFMLKFHLTLIKPIATYIVEVTACNSLKLPPPMPSFLAWLF